MNLRCDKIMKMKIDTMLSIISTDESIDIKTTTKKHRRLCKISYNVKSSSNIYWRMNPYNDNLLLITEVTSNSNRMNRILTGTVKIDEEDDKRVITSIITIMNNNSECTKRVYNSITTKITDDMYYHELKTQFVTILYLHNEDGTIRRVTPNKNVDQLMNSYIHNINEFIVYTNVASDCVSATCKHYELTFSMDNGVLIKEEDDEDEEDRDLMITEAMIETMSEAARRTFNYIRVEN